MVKYRKHKKVKHIERSLIDDVLADLETLKPGVPQKALEDADITSNGRDWSKVKKILDNI